MQLLVITSLVNIIFFLTFEIEQSLMDHPERYIATLLLEEYCPRKKDGGNEIYYWFSGRVNIPGGQQEAAA